MHSEGNENVEEKSDIIDECLQRIGSFGKYQKVLVFVMILPAILPSAFHSFNQVFLAADPKDYYCKLFPGFSAKSANLSHEEILSFLPRDVAKDSYDRCSMFDVNYTDLIAQFRSLNYPSSHLLDSSLPRIPCKFGYEYDRSVYSSSIVTDWDLVCDKAFHPTLALVLLSVGEVIGPPVFGYLADQIGRKIPYLLCFVIQLVFGIATGFAPNFATFCIFRVIIGGTYGAIYSLPFIMALEIVGPNHRATVSVLASITYSLGYIGLAGVAYFVRDWHQLSVLTSAPLVIVGLLWMFIPESPRFLLAKGRVAEAKKFFRTAAKFNGVEIDQSILDDLDSFSFTQKFSLNVRGKREEVKKRYTFLDLFRTPNLRRNTLLLTFVNFGNLAVYSGLGYYGPTLSSIPHLSFFLSGVVELPGYLFVHFTADRFGRRLPQISCMIIGGLTCIAAMLAPSDVPNAYVVFCLLGKMFITISYLIAELMEGELIPTVVRSEGSAFTEIVASALTAAVPVIVYLGYEDSALPLVVFGALACVAGFCAFFLPETFDADLPQTIADGEKFGNGLTLRERINLLPKKRPRRRSRTLIDITAACDNDKPFPSSTPDESRPARNASGQVR